MFATQLCRLLDLINRTEYFGVAHCFDVINDRFDTSATRELRSGEIHVFDSTSNVERKIPFTEADREMYA